MIYNLSLKIKILFLSIGSILIISISSLILILNSFNHQEELLKDKLYLVTVDLSNSIQDQFYDRYGDIKTFSLYFRNLHGNSFDSVNYLNQVAEHYGIYDLITVTDLNGKLLYVNNKSPKGKKIGSEILYKKNFSSYLWFKETLNKKYLEDPKKDLTKVNFQDAQFNEILEMVYAEKIYSTVFSTFIYNSNGIPIGIISAHANFNWVENIVDKIYENFVKSGLNTVELTLVDKNGVIILDYDPSANSGNINFIHDEKTLNKTNLFKSWNVAENDKIIEDGVREALHSRRNIMQVKSFKSVVGKKIVDELNWKVIIRVDRDEAFSEIIKSKIIFMAVFLIILTCVILLNLYFGFSLSNTLMGFVNKMYTGNQKLNKTSIEATEISKELSSAATEQAASLQETVTAVNEISAMMNKTADMATLSRKKSDENKIKVTEGKKTVDKMVNSISIIKSNNQDILNQVLDGNKKISEIVKVIAEIESKTKVIDEIVFQTKLLSFNASVEAARAGEHGKGFSVVAEEVGNLAQMSGNASKEISKMLDNSIDKVKKIIDETKGNVEKILESSKNGIKNGEEVSKECEGIFEKILLNTEEFNNLVYEIANSSQEQAKGVNEINFAMHELDSVTHQNSSIAQKSSQTSSELLMQIYELEEIALNLVKTVKGNKTNSIKKDIENKPDMKTKNKDKNHNQYDKKNEDKSKNRNIDINKTINKKNENMKTKADELKEGEVPSYDDSRFEEL